MCKGLMSPAEFVCVVVDECHKSTGNYATVKAVQFLKNHNVQFRVLGLSATPGRTKAAIQVSSSAKLWDIVFERRCLGHDRQSDDQCS